VVVRIKLESSRNWAALRLRNRCLGPKGPKFGVLRIQRSFFIGLEPRLGRRRKLLDFYAKFEITTAFSLEIRTSQVFRMAKPPYLSKCFSLSILKFEPDL
jgi:hypothetical protein